MGIPAGDKKKGGFSWFVIIVCLLLYYSTKMLASDSSELVTLEDRVRDATGVGVNIRYLVFFLAALVLITGYSAYKSMIGDLPKRKRTPPRLQGNYPQSSQNVKERLHDKEAIKDEFERKITKLERTHGTTKHAKPSLKEMNKKVFVGSTKKHLVIPPIDAEYSNKTFKDVAGLNELKDLLLEEVIYPMQHRELAEEYKQRVGSGVLLYGPPGCGKTFIAQAIAGQIGWPLINASGGNLIDRFAGQTENNIHNMFNKARDYAKKLGGVIVFFDEIDALGLKRSKISSGHIWRQSIVTTLSSEFDGIASNSNVFIIGATNTPWDVEPALKRTGRFSDCVFVPPPDEETRIELFKIYSEGLPLDENVDFKVLCDKTVNYASSDIAEICDAAAEIPWKEAIKKGDKRSVTMNDFEKAIEKRKSSLQEWYAILKDMRLNKEFKKIFPDLESSVKEFYAEENEKHNLEGYR